MDPLDKLPVVPTNDLPDFNSDGNLPIGEFAPTEQDFEQRFVYTGEDARRIIYEGLLRHRSALQEAGVPPEARQLLNGSFVSAAPVPGDIDIAVEIPVGSTQEIKELENAGPPYLFRDLDLSIRNEFKCHVFVIFRLPESDPDYQRVTESSIRCCTGFLAKDRWTNECKGRLWSTVGGFA